METDGTVGRPGFMHHFSKFIAVVAVGLAIAPAAAFAQSGTSTDPYDNLGPEVQERIDQGSAPTDDEGTTPVAAATDDQGGGGGGELPFTGLDVALVLGAGALLLGLGVGMRRLTRPSREIA
jgi:hypothetical protein